MNKRYITKKAIIFCIFFLFASYYLFTRLYAKIPSVCPTTIIRYNGYTVQTSLGDHNWIPKNGGSSYITEGDYTVGQKTLKFNAKLGDTVHILIPKNPLNVKVTEVLDVDNNHKEYNVVKEGKEYILTLPNKKGEYIFNVMAFWDAEMHNSATIFRVEIE